VTAQEKLLRKILGAASDANIPFEPLCSLLVASGFEQRIRGQSSDLFEGWSRGDPEPSSPGTAAKPYQVKQVRGVIMKYGLGGESDE
jgi:hypothetical protein